MAVLSTREGRHSLWPLPTRAASESPETKRPLASLRMAREPQLGKVVVPGPPISTKARVTKFLPPPMPLWKT